MEKEAIQKIIIESVTEYLEIKGKDIAVNEHSALIGTNTILDSIGLVTMVVEIESRLSEHDVEVSLTSEKAMSAAVSPFRSVNALTNFIYTQIQEQHAGR